MNIAAGETVNVTGLQFTDANQTTIAGGSGSLISNYLGTRSRLQSTPTRWPTSPPPCPARPAGAIRAESKSAAAAGSSSPATSRSPTSAFAPVTPKSCRRHFYRRRNQRHRRHVANRRQHKYEPSLRRLARRHGRHAERQRIPERRDEPHREGTAVLQGTTGTISLASGSLLSYDSSVSSDSTGKSTVLAA